MGPERPAPGVPVQPTARPENFHHAPRRLRAAAGAQRAHRSGKSCMVAAPSVIGLTSIFTWVFSVPKGGFHTTAQRRGSLLAVMPLLVLTLFLVGCPKRPATPVASAPAPTGSAMAPAPGAAPSPGAPAAPGPSALAPAAPAPGGAATSPPGTPPRPSEFSENTNLKDVFFDFDRYDVRAGDAKILDGNAAWLKSNANNLVLIDCH